MIVLELWLAVLLLVLSVAGIIVSAVCLQRRKALCIVLIVLLALVALACAVYIGLTLLFVAAVESRP